MDMDMDIALLIGILVVILTCACLKCHSTKKPQMKKQQAQSCKRTDSESESPRYSEGDSKQELRFETVNLTSSSSFSRLDQSFQESSPQPVSLKSGIQMPNQGESHKRINGESESIKHLEGSSRQELKFEAINLTSLSSFSTLDQSSRESSPQSISEGGTQMPNQGGSQKSFHTFVNDLIHLFQHQRTEDEQFAVLFLASSPGYTSIVFRTAQCEVSSPDQATDKSCLSFPADRDLCNYITARSNGPDGPYHAEARLMNRFDQLWKRYNVLMPACKYMILYMWYLPCVYCANKIAKKLGNHKLKLLLIYTKCEVPQEENDIIQSLEAQKITIIQENYKPNHALVQALIERDSRQELRFKAINFTPSGSFHRLDQSSQENSPQSISLEDGTQMPNQVEFVNDLIHLFQHQRSEDEQFAVLFLASSPGYTSIVFRTTHFQVSSPDQATDKSCLSFPADKDLCNYITARSNGPDGPHHAEPHLMNRFDQLWRRYNAADSMPACKYMVFYTWFLPCVYCANKIAKKLKDFGPKLLLIYTKCEIPQEEDDIIQSLKAHNITIIQEDYDPNHVLVKTLIELFERQRRKGYQFAVVFLDEGKIEFRIRESGVTKITERVTDSSSPIFPQDDQLCNFLTARPDGKKEDKHAEALLMKKFPELESKYKESASLFSLKGIVLYTWLLPCWSCTQRIIKTLKGNPVKIFLYYTSKMHTVSHEQEQHIVCELQKHGIKVTCKTRDEQLDSL